MSIKYKTTSWQRERFRIPHKLSKFNSSFDLSLSVYYDFFMLLVISTSTRDSRIWFIYQFCTVVCLVTRRWRNLPYQLKILHISGLLPSTLHLWKQLLSLQNLLKVIEAFRTCFALSGGWVLILVINIGLKKPAIALEVFLVGKATEYSSRESVFN